MAEIVDALFGDRARRRRFLLGLAAAAAAALPPLAHLVGEPFYIALAGRILVFALAALSLDLILGFAGLVSLGHAAFLGVGAYTVGILAAENIARNALLVWPAAMLTAGLAALATGALAVRTGGVYFIMITLAFAQMGQLLFVALKRYGADEGLSLAERSSMVGLDLGDDTIFYYVALAILATALVLSYRLTRSRFGRVLEGIRDNERRMASLGFPVYRYKLAAFAIAGALGGLAGALAAEQAEFVSPALMHWSRSGELIVMVVLGGMGTLIGPVIGATLFLLLEEVLASRTAHWPLFLGLLLIAAVLGSRRGLHGLLSSRFGTGPHG